MTSNSASKATPPEVTYGFVGIGVMGYGMALNLREKIPKTSHMILCEINVPRRDQFIAEVKEKGLGSLEIAQSPRETAEKADIIITMLPKAPHVHEAFTNPDTGFLSIDKPKDSSKSKFFLDCSTINAAASTNVGSLVASSGIGSFIDAPVSGGPKNSNAGTLTFMVGGPEDLFAKAVPILSLMGKSDAIFHCGGPGAGLATKQLNNYLAYVGFLGLCEVMNAGILYGLDPHTLSNVLNKSSGVNWNTMHQNPVKGVNPEASSARDFKGGFTTELASGVIEDAVDLMGKVGGKSVLGPHVVEVFKRALTNEKTRGMEARSVWKLFAEDEGRDLDGA